MQSRRDADNPDGAAGLERRPPVGIARERETIADDAAPGQRECRTVCQETPTFTQLGDTNFYALVFFEKAVVSGRGGAGRRERSEWSTAEDLARWLSMHRRNLVHRYLGPMVDARILKYRYPETPNRRGQAYQSCRPNS